MKVFDFQSTTAIQRVFLLRTIAIILQLSIVIAINFIMSMQIALLPLLIIIAIETLFHLLSIFYFKNRPVDHKAILIQIFADVTFLTILMYFSGGATNSFVSLLLIPIVIAAVSLPTRFLLLISVSAVLAYTGLLIQMPVHTIHHMDMSNHFIGMWANFLLSVILITFVVGAMANAITNRERLIAVQREDQLRKEQLLALGVASSQVTHQLASPLGNLQLLFDELIEDYPNDQAVLSMKKPLKQCTEQLGYFRTLATSIRENKNEIYLIDELLEQLRDCVQLNFPNIKLNTVASLALKTQQIETDAMLLPALLNLVQNGVKANEDNSSNKIDLNVYIEANYLNIELRDYGNGISVKRASLGQKLVKSETGLGMAILLSNSTLERLGGTLRLYNHSVQGAIAHVTLPIM
ncbi:hypothetical protein CJF42_01640 [Pseudoalteromonas sp. NBT06-2]|uniref:sensor histidine kinase n=1 Tax=Pseudoalteromonas sp. NBT06-2 TaxID=2025950 RepID=UPI000BA7D789|nr:ATP-binding protein [Pseudoalteromonas sp. NBT06-2]PAJ76207.1 hypothetical protein CJF42_01640 [Pseudoalteromonas sp. NBT06-2]